VLLDSLKWSELIDPKELPEPYNYMVTLIGIENTLKIANMYQGTGLYLPKLDSVLTKIRDRNIRKEFNGYNYRELAHKYNLTERWIRELILADHDINQISLFDVK
jgi:Mor family transcriptional regulator